jgi:CDP-paratose 2-epimerase
MNILITGGCGFVGSSLAIYLKKKIKNIKITSLDNLYRKGSEINLNRLKKFKIKNIKKDISDEKNLLSLNKFDLIIDCCAEPAIEKSRYEQDRVFQTNLIGTFNILKKCAKDRADIIFLSSSRVYSIEKINYIFKKKKTFLIDENFSTLSPKSLYGFTKLSSEELIKEFSYIYKFKYIINRFGVIAGPWQFGKQDQGFVSLWTMRHFLRKNLNYIGYGGTGKQIRDVLHIDDACKLIYLQILKLNKINNHIFTVGGGKKNSINLKELTIMCENITGNKIKFGRIKSTSIYDIPYFITRNNKVKKFYNWQPILDISKIVYDIYYWALGNQKMIKNFFK